MALNPDYLRMAAAATVSYKELWSDDWTDLQWLLADTVKFASGPELDKAQLLWLYGRIGYPARPTERASRFLS